VTKYNIKVVNKDTTIISDLRSFFSKSEDNRAFQCIMGVMDHIPLAFSTSLAEKQADSDTGELHIDSTVCVSFSQSNMRRRDESLYRYAFLTMKNAAGASARW